MTEPRTLQLPQVLEMVARGVTLPPVRSASMETAVRNHETEPVPFVDPSFNVGESYGSAPRVIVISAPAAVGKSYLARYIAASTGNPLWDLSRFQVGSNFFSGTLAKAYGGAGYAEVESALRENRAALILDASDEALVKAGLTNFEQAIDDLAELLSSGAGGPAVAVILGRPESVTFTCVKLTEAKIAWQLLGVDFFNEEKSRDFIRIKYESIAERDANQNVDDYISKVFDLVLQAIGNTSDWDTPEIRSFLGYAPVLDALAELAGEGNVYAELQTIQAQGGARIWTFLRDVIEGILRRELRKFTTSFAGEDTDTRSLEKRKLAESVYSPRHQLAMLLTPSLEQAEVLIPSNLDDQELGEAVVIAARNQLREHPFLRTSGSGDVAENPLTRLTNIAFRDYVSAWSLTSSEESISERVVAFAQSETISASPLLIRMILAQEGENWLPIGALGLLMDSAATILENDSSVRVTIFEDVHLVSSDAPVNIVMTVSSGDGVLAKIRASGKSQEVIQLNRSCRSALIDVPSCSVSIGSGLRDFSMGPDVAIFARGVVANAEHVRVPSGESVVIETEFITGTTKRLTVLSDGGVVIRSKRADFPWAPYRRDMEVRHISAGALLTAAMDLRGVCRWFWRSSMVDAQNYPRNAMDTIRAKGRIPVAMFDYLLSKSMIRSVGEVYQLQLSVSGASIREVDLSDEKLNALLVDFLEHAE